MAQHARPNATGQIAEGEVAMLPPLRIGGLTVVVISARSQTADPMFFEMFGLDIGKADEGAAKARLTPIVKNALRNEINQLDLKAVVSSGRSDLTGRLLEEGLIAGAPVAPDPQRAADRDARRNVEEGALGPQGVRDRPERAVARERLVRAFDGQADAGLRPAGGIGGEVAEPVACLHDAIERGGVGVRISDRPARAAREDFR